MTITEPASVVLASDPPAPVGGDLGHGDAERRRRGDERRSTLVLLATAAATVGWSAAVAHAGPILGSRGRLLLIIGGWWVTWLAAVLVARRVPVRRCLLIVCVAGVLARAVALGGLPTLSDDLYRYAWDGRVQSAHVDPYRYPPQAQPLTSLREPWLWPSAAGCADLNRPVGCTRINRPDQPTIYPPLAQSWFRAVYRVAGGVRHRATTWQGAGAAMDVIATGLILLALRRSRLDLRLVAIYALCPAAILETAQNGHVDGLALVLVLSAVLASLHRRVLVTGVLLGAAALVKLHPAALVLPLVAPLAVGGISRRLRTWSLAALGVVGVFVAGYLPHVLAVGTKVIGYLPGYLREEHYSTGGRFLLVDLLHLPHVATMAAGVVIVAATGVWVMVRSPAPAVGAVRLLGALLLVVTPVQTWYALVLVGLAVVADEPFWIAVSAAGYPYFFAVILDNPHAAAIGQVSYGIALLIVVAGLRERRRQRAGLHPGIDEAWPAMAMTVDSR